MEARASSYPSRSGVVFGPPPLPPYYQFVVDHRAVNNPNTHFPVSPPPYSVVDPSAVPPPPPYGVLVPCNFPVTIPVNPALFIRMDEQRSKSLLQVKDHFFLKIILGFWVYSFVNTPCG